jgi:hypothetical protein
MTRRPPFSRRQVLALLAGSCVLPRGAGAASDAVPVLIELFTSQGCSSCPAADAFAGELRKDPLNYVVSLNVDYWDYLGWHDTLAKPEYSRRQFDYGKSRGDMEVYTPQMVMNGHYHAVGSNPAEVKKFIAECREEGLRAALHLYVTGKEVKVAIPAQSFTGEATLWLMAIAPEVTAQIERGENAGKSVTYHNVVRNMVPAALWKGEAYEGAWMRDAVIPPDCTACLAVLQKDKTGQVIGLARA